MAGREFPRDLWPSLVFAPLTTMSRKSMRLRKPRIITWIVKRRRSGGKNERTNDRIPFASCLQCS
jgi:hypothetical protein